MTERDDVIAGLRALADALTSDETLPLPFHGSATELLVFCESKDELIAYRRVLGRADKQITNDGSYDFSITGTLHGLKLKVLAHRDEVCTRRVVGTREVTRFVPDPACAAAVPLIEVTETVEDVEWDCHPLLAAPTGEEVSA